MKCPICPGSMVFDHWVCETRSDQTLYYYSVWVCHYCGTKIKAPVGEVLEKGRARVDVQSLKGSANDA